MTQRSFKLLSIALILTLFTVFLAACGAKSTKTTAPATTTAATDSKITLPETLRIGFISVNNNKTITGPEGWAQSKGYLESELKKYGVKEFNTSIFQMVLT